MLWHLSIKNLAIIDDVSIEFAEGLNILTGETGAGKSIIIDAINLIVGARADRELIRNGESMASVEAIFTLDGNEELASALKELDFMDGDETELLITRQIYSNGRNVIRINGRAVVASVLRDISQLLIDIHGQHQHQSLLDKSHHIEFLDSFDSSIKPVKENIKSIYSEWCELKEQIDDIDTNKADFERNKELMEYQINEIEQAELKIGEDDELIEKKQILKNSQAIIAALESAYASINSGRRDGGDGALGLLYTAKERLGGIARYSDEYSEIYDATDSVYYELEDISDSIGRILHHVSYSEEQAEEIDDRLYVINSLKRKYGKTIESVLDFAASLGDELEKMQYNMDNSEELHKKERALYKELKENCDTLHARREKASRLLEDRIISELSFLGMKKVRFEVSISAHEDDISSDGYDDVEFLISANVGEPLRPLAKIASGGEVSRIMLSIKSALADIDKIPTMIFDEIDTGISGAVAGAAGKKMHALSKNHQIICITHQAQIAACADCHFFVKKALVDDKTKTFVKVLDEDERIENIAAMISGNTVTQSARAHARELIESNLD